MEKTCKNCNCAKPGYWSICATEVPPKDENNECAWWEPIRQETYYLAWDDAKKKIVKVDIKLN